MGQLAQAAQNPNTYAPQPSGFNAQEWIARAGGMGLKGLGQGLQSYDQQNSMLRQPQGGGGMMPSQGAAPVDSSYFLPQQSRKPNSLFYGYGS